MELVAELEAEVRSLRDMLKDERTHFESELAKEKTKYRVDAHFEEVIQAWGADLRGGYIHPINRHPSV